MSENKMANSLREKQKMQISRLQQVSLLGAQPAVLTETNHEQVRQPDSGPGLPGPCWAKLSINITYLLGSSAPRESYPLVSPPEQSFVSLEIQTHI